MCSLKTISKVNAYLHFNYKICLNISNLTILLSKHLCFIYPVFNWNLYSKSVYFRLKNSN